jgi:hypothetical protein
MEIPNESNSNQPERRPRWPAFFFWGVFILGLVAQAFAPRLKIERNAFVMPQSMVSAGKQVDPVAIVERERKMQLLSLLLTVTGAVGLGFYYQKALFGRRRSD